MQETTATNLEKVRFVGDLTSYQAIDADQELRRALAETQALIAAHPTRQRLLSTSVQVSPRLLPQLATVFRDVAERAKITKPLELYVWASADINACVMPAQDHILVMLTSGAIERLEAEELSFVIGHELGHAIFGHLELPVQSVLERCTKLNARQSMQLLAWNRKSEISADRAGLICCGDVQVAASALFKSLSGLAFKGLRIDPDDFASQWDELAAEMSKDATDESWRALHPFPPLRMKALLLFWDSDQARQLVAGAPGKRALAETDSTVERYLAMMDPLARTGGTSAQEGGDPLLSDFLLWGGLYVAAADGKVEASEVQNLCAVVGREQVERALAAAPDAGTCRARFLEARTGRRRKLRALELHTIFSGLAAVARADGLVHQTERDALHELAKACSIAPAFIDNLLGS